MALSNNGGEGLSAADVAAVCGNRGDGFGFGDGNGSLFYLLILFLFAGGFNGGWGNGWGNGGVNNAVTDSLPWLMTQNVDNDVQNGFNQMATTNALSGIQSAITSGFGDTALGIAGINQSICNSTNNLNTNLTNGFAAIEAGANSRQMANMQQNFDNTLALINGFNGVNQSIGNVRSQIGDAASDQKAAAADLRYTIATEACSNRTLANENAKDLQMSQFTNTQSLLNAINSGIQSIKDDMCQDRLDAQKRETENLRQQLSTVQMQSFINGQTAQLIADNAIQTQQVENYIRPQINPCYVVPNPYCNCGNNYNTGCCGN